MSSTGPRFRVIITYAPHVGNCISKASFDFIIAGGHMQPDPFGMALMRVLAAFFSPMSRVFYKPEIYSLSGAATPGALGIHRVKL